MRDRDIANIGNRACHMVHKPGKLIHTDVRLHAEVPLIALLRLVHLRITRLVKIAGQQPALSSDLVQIGSDLPWLDPTA